MQLVIPLGRRKSELNYTASDISPLEEPVYSLNEMTRYWSNLVPPPSKCEPAISLLHSILDNGRLLNIEEKEYLVVLGI